MTKLTEKEVREIQFSIEAMHENNGVDFKEQVFELAFGDNAFEREYTEKEVINILREFSNKALQNDKLIEALKEARIYMANYGNNIEVKILYRIIDEALTQTEG